MNAHQSISREIVSRHRHWPTHWIDELKAEFLDRAIGDRNARNVILKCLKKNMTNNKTMDNKQALHWVTTHLSFILFCT